MTMPNVRSIFIIIANVITYANGQVMELIIEEVDNEALATTIRVSMEENVVIIVSTTKSSIDTLEKVKMKLHD